ncbi:MAG: formylglycine-generating enzyme family protein [Methanosarcinaceae archaeon]|nr:formylglycine-generating enzyme family protein [Methanosarcinaceae archaeon]
MDSQIEIKRETEFYQGFIRLKMSVSNKASSVITDVTLDFLFENDLLRIDHYEPSYERRNGKILLGNINGGTSKSIAVYFDPLMCSRGTEIECQLNYKDAGGNRSTFFMEPKLISVVCPIIKTELDINVGRLKEFIEKLPSKDSKVYEIQHGFDISKLVSIAREIVEKHDFRHVRTLMTKDGRAWEIWYYGKTKVTKADIVIEVSISSEKQHIELFAATESAEALTGLLAEVGRDLKQGIESRASGKGNIINVTIKDSVVQRSNLLDLCSMDGICPVNILVEDSVIQQSTLISEKDTTGEELERKKPLSHENVPPQKPLFPPTAKKQESSSGKRILFFSLIFGLLLIGAVVMFPGSNGDSGNTPQEIQPVSINTTSQNTDEDTPEATAKTNIAQKTSPQIPDAYMNTVGMEFVKIPTGEFMMGSPSDESDRFDDEGPVHKVTIEESYYLSKYEVTQKQWLEVMGSNPSNFKGDDLPVEEVSWNDIQEFIEKLNEMEDTDKYRLPSEAEWEYACRADTTTEYYFGDSESQLGDYAWYHENSDFKTHPVGQKKPNFWGLYDMYGNVWECCQDRYHDDYDETSSDGSAWEDGNNSARVSRGGCWSDYAGSCRSARRGCDVPVSNNNVLGFRLLREI